MQKNIYALLIVALIIYAVWGVLKIPTDSPTETPTSTENTKRDVSLLAVGDINLGRVTGQKILGGNYDYAFENIDGYIKKFDIAFGNLESQLADLGGETQSPTSEYRFAGPPEGAIGLKTAGWDIVSTANNHMWDYGKDALFETMENLEQAGIKYTGSRRRTEDLYKPTIIESNGQKIAFLAGTMLLNGYEKSGALDYVAWADTEELTSAIADIKDDVDWIIVSIHGGVEYVSKPIASKQTLAHELIDAGADIVIGHHTHIPQGIEEYKDGVIFYSLGNFAFWQPFGYWTEHTFVPEITLKTDNTFAYQLTAINSGWQPSLAQKDDVAKILDHIQELSSKLGGNGTSTD